MNDSNPIVTTSENLDLSRSRAAYRRLLAEIDAVPASSLLTINIDIPTAVTTARGALPEIALLGAELGKARELLLSDVQPLARRGIIPANRVIDFKRGLGHRGIALDVEQLAEILREHWPTVSTKTALTLEQLQRFADVADRLMTAVGLREQGPRRHRRGDCPAAAGLHLVRARLRRGAARSHLPSPPS
jgi:hypothetical protein